VARVKQVVKAKAPFPSLYVPKVYTSSPS
jgi:hypothetical protein